MEIILSYIWKFLILGCSTWVILAGYDFLLKYTGKKSIRARYHGYTTPPSNTPTVLSDRERS